MPTIAGKGWYRLNPQADAAVVKPHRAWLQFDGASIVSDVWLNGVHLGHHHGGVSRVRFAVSDAVHQGENQLETLLMGRDWILYGGCIARCP